MLGNNYIYIDPWLFLVLCLSAAGGYVGVILYAAHWWMHKRIPKPKLERPVILRADGTTSDYGQGFKG
jgi:fatty acid desaturase